MRDIALGELGLTKLSLRTKNRLCSLSDYYKKIHNQGLIKENPNYRQGKGIPQGSPISGLLSNIYLLDFDKELSTFVKQIGGFYRRYCDDIVVVCNQADAIVVERMAKNLIASAHLEIQPDKTVVTYFRELKGRAPRLLASKNLVGNPIRKPMQYLGFEFDGSHSYLRSSTIARFIRNLIQKINSQIYIRKKNWLKANNAGKAFAPQLNEQKLLKLFSHFGRRNLQSYARRADEKQSRISRIPQQLKKLEIRVQNEIMKGQNVLQKLTKKTGM